MLHSRGRAEAPVCQAKRTIEVGGVPVARTSAKDAVRYVLELSVRSREASGALPVRFVNAYSIALADQMPAYHHLLRGEGINFPDGKPVAAMVSYLAGGHAHQVRGPQFFEEFIREGLAEGIRHFFFGTTDQTLECLQSALRARYPGVVIAGALAPEFGTPDEILCQENIDAIHRTQPDVVWVGLGTPKQDFVAAKLAPILGLPVLGVGAAFDFSAGTLRTAPDGLQRYGLEWLYRLYCEPRRLWRRYFFGNARFIKLALGDVCRAAGRH